MYVYGTLEPLCGAVNLLEQRVSDAPFHAAYVLPQTPYQLCSLACGLPDLRLERNPEVVRCLNTKPVKD